MAGQLGDHGYWLVVQAVVCLAVKVLLPSLVAHAHPKLGRHGHKPGIEEFVEFGVQC